MEANGTKPPTLQDQIAALLAECERATPGPRLHCESDLFCIIDASGRTSDACDVAFVNEEKEDWALPGRPIDNARFIASARSGYPAALRGLALVVAALESANGVLAYASRKMRDNGELTAEMTIDCEIVAIDAALAAAARELSTAEGGE